MNNEILLALWILLQRLAVLTVYLCIFLFFFIFIYRSDSWFEKSPLDSCHLETTRYLFCIMHYALKHTYTSRIGCILTLTLGPKLLWQDRDDKKASSSVLIFMRWNIFMRQCHLFVYP